MNTQTTPVQIETKLGTLYVAIGSASRNTYRNMDGGTVVNLRPVVWVSSAPEFTAMPGTERHWTIRGRAYGVHLHMFSEEQASGGWHKQYEPYNGGFRNDRGAQVDFGTKTYDLMWNTLITALDSFTACYPGWEDASRYLLLSRDAEAAASRADAARREAEEHDAAAADARTGAKRYAAVLPGNVIDLIK